MKYLLFFSFFPCLLLTPSLFGMQGSFYRNNSTGYLPASMERTIKTLSGNVEFLSQEEYEQKEEEAHENPIRSLEIRDNCVKFTVLVPYINEDTGLPLYKKRWFGLRKTRIGLIEKEYFWNPKEEGKWPRILKGKEQSKLDDVFSRKCIDQLKKRPELCKYDKMPSLGQLDQNLADINSKQNKELLTGLTLSVVGSTLASGVAGKTIPIRLSGAAMLAYSMLSADFYGKIDRERSEINKLRIQKLFLRDLYSLR